MSRPLAILALALFIPSLSHLHADDLIQESAWTPLHSGIFSFGNAQIAAKRRSYESATIVSNNTYENVDFSFEFRLERWCELILAIHVPENLAWDAGLELVLSDHNGSGPSLHKAGALLGHVPPAAVSIKKSGEWNACRVLYDWPRFQVDLNGIRIQDIDLSSDPGLRYKLRRGPIAFRDLLGWGFQIRNAALISLPDSEHGVTLYNGRDFTGWREVRKSDAVWEPNGPILTGKNGNGYLQHEALVQDFDLRLYYRTTPTANGGVFFRWMPDDSDRGNEIQILDVPASVSPSASIYNVQRADPAPMRPVGEWQLLQLSVDGAHAATLLNGIQTAETNALTKIRPGHITLQMHKENSTIEFKDLVLIPR